MFGTISDSELLWIHHVARGESRSEALSPAGEAAGRDRASITQPRQAGPSTPGPELDLVFALEESPQTAERGSSQSSVLPPCSLHKIATATREYKLTVSGSDQVHFLGDLVTRKYMPISTPSTLFWAPGI